MLRADACAHDTDVIQRSWHHVRSPYLLQAKYKKKEGLESADLAYICSYMETSLVKFAASFAHTYNIRMHVCHTKQERLRLFATHFESNEGHFEFLFLSRLALLRHIAIDFLLARGMEDIPPRNTTV